MNKTLGVQVNIVDNGAIITTTGDEPQTDNHSLAVIGIEDDIQTAVTTTIDTALQARKTKRLAAIKPVA
jgi:hypothetical protein